MKEYAIKGKSDRKSALLIILNMVWGGVNCTLFRLTPSHTRLFNWWRIMLARMFGARIDYSCSLHPKAKIDCPWNLTMSERSSLGENSWTYALAPIRIGKNVCIGKDVYLLTGSHDVTRKSFDLITKPIEIGDECWVATDATVMPGVKLAGYTVVAAEALVNKNTEPYDIVGGNPAKFIKKREISD